ncbi:hypothetical protein SAMN05216174_1327 [Actinokineospora iranica]|uniref:Uncharacterized protein n=1 Tax=Actinokineospora iranica TaxID=1271860 RepID=A0A1G6ZGZ7_9PSEU|nr:hypothetical protein SAMN05216174_1327 [Actinokineospora iranica]
MLASRLGIPVANLASDGGSNRRIVRTTVGNLDRVCREFGVPVEETLVLCMWTCVFRNEYHLRRPRDRTGRTDLPYETDWKRLGPWNFEEDDNASNAHFRSMLSEKGGTINLLTDWVLLDSYLRLRGAVPRYTFAWNVLPSKMPAEAVDLFRQLDRTSVYGNKFESNGNSINQLTWKKFEFGPGKHPLEAGHAYFAALLEAWLRDQGLKFPERALSHRADGADHDGAAS